MVLSFLIFLISLFPVYEYFTTAHITKAKYDIRISGPIAMGDYEKIRVNVTEAVPFFHISDVYIHKLSEPNKRVYLDDVLILDQNTAKDESKLKIIGIKNLIIGGEVKSEYNKSIMGWNLAKELDMKIGDSVTFRICDTEMDYELSAIMAPNRYAAVVISNPVIEKCFKVDSGDEFASGLYIKTEDINATIAMLKKYRDEREKQWSIITREELLISTFTPSVFYRKLKNFITIGSFFLILTALVNWRKLILSDLNKDVQRSIEKRHIFLKHAALGGTVVIFASLIVKLFIYERFFSMYLPTEVLLQKMALVASFFMLIFIFLLINGVKGSGGD